MGMLPAHLTELQRVQNLIVAMEWACGCPDGPSRSAVIDLILEEIRAVLEGIIRPGIGAATVAGGASGE